MKTALSMFHGVLFEIDQFQSEVFDHEDFNFWMPKAVDKWLTLKLEEYERNQVVSDKISCLVKKSNTIPLNSDNNTDVRQFDVPNDYRHLLNCLVRLRYKQATVTYAVNAKRDVYTKRYTGDNEATFLDNYYTKPFVSDSDVRLYHRSLGKKVSLLFDTPVYPNPSVVIESAAIEYLMEPPVIQLAANLSITQDTVFPEHANREIVVLCAALFLEKEQSQRLQSHAGINN